jgi:hypothetical protein
VLPVVLYGVKIAVELKGGGGMAIQGLGMSGSRVLRRIFGLKEVGYHRTFEKIS